MYPEDRVLIGVINRKVDFEMAREHGWYRIPVERAPRMIETEYLGFFLSSEFGKRNGSICYYARCKGHELVRRRDLLPDEADHKRADKWYYKFSIGPLQEKTPPISNPTRRSIAFVFSTWDRFIAATKIADLYSTADFYVERVSRALNAQGIDLAPDQLWQDGDLRRKISTLRRQLSEILAKSEDEDDVSTREALQEAIKSLGDLPFLDIPFEG
ncbi:MAG: hypothetical protein U0528_08505 [Anaerolineae bacterium]|nr:hypothetical protein [Anaerolineae bacterium]